MHARTFSRATGLLVVALIFAACGGGASPAPTAGTPTAGTPTAALATVVPTGPVALPTPEKPKLTIGLSGEFSTGNLHAGIAAYLKLGERYGLDLTFTPFSGGSQVVQALIAGQIDVSDNSAGPVIASLATDSPLVMTFITRSNLTDIMYSQAAIKTAADLRGQSIAISAFGSQSHAGALLAVKSLGLTDKDVTITQIGNDSARLAALQGGSVGASMNDAVREGELTPLGFNVLVRLSEVQGLGGVPRTSLTVTKEFAAANPNTVLALSAMYLEANLMWREHPDIAAKAYAQLAQIPEADAKAEIDIVAKEPWIPLDGRCDPTVMEFTKETLLVTNPDLATVTASEACTNQFLDQLDSLGWEPDTDPPAS
jgi:ABC-type nitrate/sulfonate/bicarbonate transport system substrate-binding protein